LTTLLSCVSRFLKTFWALLGWVSLRWVAIFVNYLHFLVLFSFLSFRCWLLLVLGWLAWCALIPGVLAGKTGWMLDAEYLGVDGSKSESAR
jgi:uncharacterized membrane protein